MTTPITIIGNLTADPELRFTPSGKAVCNFTVAVNERVKNQATGEWEDGEGSFYNCTAWGEYGEHVAESVSRGVRVIVKGDLKMRSYERREGGKGLSADINIGNDGGVGPDLKWATAKVTRMTRNNNQGGQTQGGYAQGNPQGGTDPQGGYSQGGQPAYAAAPANDPWGAPSEEPPF